MSSRHTPFLALLAATLLLGGCGDDPIRTVSVITSGAVELRDQLGERLPPEDVRVQVDVPGTSATVTGSDGAWTFEGLPPGLHTLSFSKAGFGPVSLFDVPADTAGVVVLLPERSSAVVTAVDAVVDESCGTSPCLDLTIRVGSEGLFAPGARRRIFRVFLGPVEELGDRNYERTFLLLVTDDDPGLSMEGEEAVIQFENIRGLELAPSGAGEAPGVLVVGATENADVAYPGRDGVWIYPDLAPAGALTQPARDG